jgi:hypothetical protein
MQVIDFNPNSTSLCAFEICPGEIFSVNFTRCESEGEGVGMMSLFGYSNEEALGQARCGEEAVYLDSAGYSSCRLVRVYQTCLLE